MALKLQQTLGIFIFAASPATIRYLDPGHAPEDRFLIEPESQTEAGVPPPAWLIVLITAVLCGLFLLLRHHPLSLIWLEDLPVYVDALHAFIAGGDPYALNHYGLHFVYPPVVMIVAAWFTRLLPVHAGRLLFTTVHVAAVLAMPFVLARYYVRARWWGRCLPLLILAAEPAFVGFRALYSANIAPAFYLAALLAAIPGLRRNRWHWFYLVVVMAALVKITLLVLLLLPLLAGKRQWIGSVASGATAVAANLLEQRLCPGLYAGYKSALVQQVAVQQQYGAGIFGFAARVERHVHGKVGFFAYSLHVAFVLFMLFLLFQLKQRYSFQPGTLLPAKAATTTTLWLGVLIIAVILANPRVLHYDMYIALFAAYAILAVSLRVDRWKLLALAIILHLPSLLVVMGLRSYSVQTAWELVVVLSAFAVGVRQLWRSSPSLPVVEKVQQLAASSP